MSAERPARPSTSQGDAVHLLDAVASADPASTSALYRVFVVPALSAIAPGDWDRLLEPDDAPLLSWGYLEGLEASGCVGGSTSWQPAHFLVRKLPLAEKDELPALDEGQLIAAAPAYLKYNSDGEWVDDFEWAAFAEHKGLPYYPKLVFAVPFNPVGGGRLLVDPGLVPSERDALRKLILHAGKRLCQLAHLSSVHVLFPRPDEALLSPIESSGFLPRQQEQYHFRNQSTTHDGRYTSFDDFLSELRSHRRHSIRRERRALVDEGYRLTTHRGLEGPSRPQGFTRDDLDRMFDLYDGTSHRYTGMAPYLNRRFFHLCAERLGDRLELVLARDAAGTLVAGAWNLRGDRRLFGRYWGMRDGDRIPFLHFETCYYHSVERCIVEGFDAFEPGHGGEHKLVRGFTPVLTHSAHFLRDARLRRPIATYLGREKPAVLASLEAARLRNSLKSQDQGTHEATHENQANRSTNHEDGNVGPSSRTD